LKALKDDLQSWNKETFRNVYCRKNNLQVYIQVLDEIEEHKPLSYEEKVANDLLRADLENLFPRGN
jgi:hypothetical protein